MLVDDRSNDLPFLIALGGIWNLGPAPEWDLGLELLSALGIADADEIRRWEKFVAAEDPLAKQASVRSRAAVIERFEGRLRELGKTAEREEADMRRFFTLIYEARAIELVDDARIAAWQEEYIVREPRADESAGTFVGSFEGSGSDLGRIVRSIAPPAERRRGFRIDAIEIYEGGLVIRWQHLRPERSYSGELTWPEDEVESVLSPDPHQLEISDDRGTDFSFGVGGSSGTRSDDGAALNHGVLIYEKRPDPEAKALYIKAGESHFEVDLEHSRE